MYKILKITKKLNGNFNLYIKDYKDEKLEVHLETLYSYGLLSKKEMDEKEFEDMLAENEKKLAKQKALKTLSMANKTKKELILKLKQSKFSTEAIDYAMTFVDRYDFIEKKLRTIRDDDKYKVRNKLMSALSYRGFSYDIIRRVSEHLLKDFGQEDEYYYD